MWEFMRSDNNPPAKHIIIDDGQSVTPDKDGYVDWYQKAEDVLKRNNQAVDGELEEVGFLWVFADMSQKNNRNQTGLPSYGTQLKVGLQVLNKVVRNPTKVFNEAVTNYQKLFKILISAGSQIIGRSFTPSILFLTLMSFTLMKVW